MKTIAILVAVLTVGCSLNLALYKDGQRSVLSFEGTGAETFCSEGVDTVVVDVRPIGWGTHECKRGIGE